MAQQMTRTSGGRRDGKDPKRRDQRAGPSGRTTSTTGMIVKVIVLGVVAGLAILGAFPLVEQRAWLWLAVLVIATAALFWIYLTPRAVPAKYLAVGTLFLLAFQIFPVVYTMGTAFTNFGDGHRGSKDNAIEAIVSASVTQAENTPTYRLTIATTGTDTEGALAFLVTDPSTGEVFAGTSEGLQALPAGQVETGEDGAITAAEGFTVLSTSEAAARQQDLADFSVPLEDGELVNAGLTRAVVGVTERSYDAGCDCITDAETGQVWTADDTVGSFISEDGAPLAQGWRVNVGFRNFTDVLTDENIREYFLQTLVWNFAFAFLVVALTFALGLLIALVLNHERLRGQRLYRSLLILPYAMPGFAMLLVWRDMFNTDFGLVNRLFGLDVNWFGDVWSARFAVLLVQLWMGYPYMFLVCTGALQSIPGDLKEAASVDGAKALHAFRTVTFPLLLIAVAPLLITTFAFNFNNFNAIYLVSEGGPFPADNPRLGGTDLLITYTYRLAFGAQGAEYGFAAAISIFIFLIVAVVSIIGFRRTRALEEVNA